MEEQDLNKITVNGKVLTNTFNAGVTVGRRRGLTIGFVTASALYILLNYLF